MSAVDDMKELQDIINDPPGFFEEETGRQSPRRQPQAEASEGAPAYAKVNLSQWVIEPNERFSATGSTDPKLPAGIYKIEIDNYGVLHFVKTPVLTDNLIDLHDVASEKVIKGIRLFWESRDEFVNRGILFKRGILLWGPAGSGKTVTCMFLVKDLISRDGIVLLCQHPAASIIAMQQLRRIEPDRPLIVLLEDIEELISRYGEHDLLGLLDGEHQVDNVVHIATTNYPERLGARIVNRPSRFDEVIKIPFPNEAARCEYLTHALKDEKNKPDIATWIKDTKDMSIAHLRELVVATTCLKRPYEETIERLKAMRIKPKSSDIGTGVGFGANS